MLWLQGQECEHARAPIHFSFLRSRQRYAWKSGPALGSRRYLVCRHWSGDRARCDPRPNGI